MGHHGLQRPNARLTPRQLHAATVVGQQLKLQRPNARLAPRQRMALAESIIENRCRSRPAPQTGIMEQGGGEGRCIGGRQGINAR